MSKTKLVLFLSITFLIGLSTGAGLLYLWLETRNPSPKEKETESHTVTGEVFLQVKNGEVRRAPGCQVYAFNGFSPRGKEWSDAISKIGEAVGAKKINDKQAVEVLRLAIESVFWKTFSQEPSASESMKRITEDRQYQVVCDSNGRFALNLPPGFYHVVAEGRAGLNEAVWITSITVNGSQKISLATPVASYFDSGR